ncbi:MAG TPA: sigma factor, partial [Sphingomicrobium sp.]|nr:sigma factor [Sphingomicrobium sp.]
MISGLDGRSAEHAQLLRALAPILRSYYGARLGGGDGDIEDLVQETLIAVHSKRATYDRNRSFTAWLFAIARYKMIDHFRRTRRLVPLAGLERELAGHGFADASDARLDAEDLL